MSNTPEDVEYKAVAATSTDELAAELTLHARDGWRVSAVGGSSATPFAVMERRSPRPPTSTTRTTTVDDTGLGPDGPANRRRSSGSSSVRDT